MRSKAIFVHFYSEAFQRNYALMYSLASLYKSLSFLVYTAKLTDDQGVIHAKFHYESVDVAMHLNGITPVLWRIPPVGKGIKTLWF